MNFDTNPWLLLPREAPYVLGIDQESITGYNKSVSDTQRQVIVDSIPEPFIGSINSAKLVLLSLNPGHSDKDVVWHSRPDFKEAMFANLRQSENQDYPFYPLNPRFAGNGAGDWWSKRTKQLKEESGLGCKAFAKKLLVIEWFPYHTGKSPSLIKHVTIGKGAICNSQYYSLQLATEMRAKGILVVGMRSEKQWADLGLQLSEIPFLNNPQSSYVSRGNTTASLFQQMLNALRHD